jgi:hypothetical protein
VCTSAPEQWTLCACSVRAEALLLEPPALAELPDGMHELRARCGWLSPHSDAHVACARVRAGGMRLRRRVP